MGLFIPGNEGEDWEHRGGSHVQRILQVTRVPFLGSLIERASLFRLPFSWGRKKESETL